MDRPRAADGGRVLAPGHVSIQPIHAGILFVASPIAALEPVAGGRAFALGLLTGAVYFSGTLYWLVETMTTFGGLSTPLAVVAAALLIAYLALFPAFFAAMLHRCVRTFGTTGLLLAPAVWVATEMGRTYIWDGFPWELLGYSQVTVLPIAQLASVVGVYGLSAVVALVSAACAYAAVETRRARWRPRWSSRLRSSRPASGAVSASARVTR